MKKILIFILLVSPFIACDDNMNKEEQFEKFILLVQNGYKEYSIEFNEAGAATLPISVGINGTTSNNQDIRVRIGLDLDTLAGYNFDKYKTQTALYNAVLPSGNFALTPADSAITIPSGKEYMSFTLELKNLNALPNKYAEYILPFAVKEVSNFMIAKSNNSKLLMRLLFSNSFSGNYTSTGNVYEEGGGDTPGPNRMLNAISYNECYAYAGNVDVRDTNRDKYIVHYKLNDDGTVTMSALHDEIEFHQESGSVEIKEAQDASDSRLKIVNTQIKVKYTYKNLSNPDFPVKMTTDIQLTNTKTVNTAL